MMLRAMLNYFYMEEDYHEWKRTICEILIMRDDGQKEYYENGSCEKDEK